MEIVRLRNSFLLFISSIIIMGIGTASQKSPQINHKNHVQDNLLETTLHHNSRAKRQLAVQNEYERLYLCVFTLFTNPNCRNNHQQQPQHKQSDASSNNGFVSFVPQNNNHFSNFNNGLFGFGSNGIFGGRFGLNPQGTFVPASYNPFFHQQPAFYPQQNFQTPYPEQQVNRRPGPAHSLLTTTTSTARTTPNTTFSKRVTTATTKPPQRWWQVTTATTLKPTTTAITTTFSQQVKDSNSSSTTPLPLPNSATTTQPTKCVNITSTTTPTTTRRTTTTTPSSKLNTLCAKENSLLKTDIQNYQLQNKYLQDALSTLQSENGQLRSRVASLERTNDHLQKQNGQLQHHSIQVKELRGRVKYLEEKVVRIARQGVEEQRRISADCKEKVKELEAEIQRKAEPNRQNSYRDELSTSSTEVTNTETPDVIVETTMLPPEAVEQTTFSLTNSDDPGETTIVPDTEVIETQKNASTPTNKTLPSSPSETIIPLIQFGNHMGTNHQHAGIIFDTGDEEDDDTVFGVNGNTGAGGSPSLAFGLAQISGPDDEEDDDSNESDIFSQSVGVLPHRAFEFGGSNNNQGALYPFHFDSQNPDGGTGNANSGYYHYFKNGREYHK